MAKTGVTSNSIPDNLITFTFIVHNPHSTKVELALKHGKVWVTESQYKQIIGILYGQQNSEILSHTPRSSSKA